MRAHLITQRPSRYRAEEADLAQPDLWNTEVTDPQSTSRLVDTAIGRRRVDNVLPAYNREAASLPCLLGRIDILAASQPVDVFIDDGSSHCPTEGRTVGTRE